jgi:hypothetical protein
VYGVNRGGHGDYSGNEVNMIDLLAAAPAWVELLAPSATVANGDYYADGRPSACHTYYGQQFDATNGLVMLFGGSRYDDGFVRNVVDSYSVAGNAYAAAAAHPSMPTGATGLGGQELKAFCRDDRNGDVYAFANFNVGKWSRSGDSWSMPVSGQTITFCDRTGSCWDSARNRIFLVGDGVCATYEPDTNTFTDRAIGGTDITAAEDMGVVYEPTLDKYIVRQSGSGATLYEIDPVTFACTSKSLTGGGSIPGVFNGNGVFNRFLYVPSQRGVVYWPDYTGGFWFIRTH